MQGITNAITSSENLELYYTKSETDVLLNAKAAKATTLAGYGITDAYTKTQVDSSLSGKASTSLDNLSSAGQMIIDSANGTISNCILEIPQNIKCSIASNVVTLTTGSILTNTGATYATTTLSANQIYTIDNSLADGNYLLCSNGVAIQAPLALSVTGSGSSLPADGSTYTYFFNVTDKLIYKYADGAWSATSYCYPFALVTMSNGVATFAKDANGNDIIFNGWCYIGGSNGTQVSMIVFPGIKYFLPNGLNTNGRLNNQEYTTRAVIITSRTSGITNANICLEQNGLSVLLNYNYREVDELPATASSGMVCYNRKTNLFYRYITDHWQNTLEIVFLYFTKNATGIADIQVRQPYDGARYLLTDDLYKQIGDVETLLAAI